MIGKGFRINRTHLMILFAILLAAAGLSRYLETDSGNILIHDIDVESYEGFTYGARLFRPIQASSLNLRPAVLLIPGTIGSRYFGDHIAMELARRGYVVLTMEDFSQGNTEPAPQYETENLADAGYTFLVTRSFTDHDRIGIAAFYEGCKKALDAQHWPDFNSRNLISPEPSVITLWPHDAVLYLSKNDDISDETDKGSIFPATYPDMAVSSHVISSLLEQIHKDLIIPDDSPFWISADSLRCGVMLILRMLLPILMLMICTGLCVYLTAGGGKVIFRGVMGILLPAALFLGLSEFFNNFLISVRAGIPFGYVPVLSQVKTHFSPLLFLGCILGSLIGSLSLRIRNTRVYVIDILSAAFILIIITGVLPVLFGNHVSVNFFRSGPIWLITAIGTGMSIIHSLLIRFSANNRHSLIIVSTSLGVIYFIICSGFNTAFSLLGGS